MKKETNFSRFSRLPKYLQFTCLLTNLPYKIIIPKTRFLFHQKIQKLYRATHRHIYYKLKMLTTVEATSCRPRIFPREEERGETKGWRIGYARCRVELADDYSNLLRNVRGAGDASWTRHSRGCPSYNQGYYSLRPLQLDFHTAIVPVSTLSSPLEKRRVEGCNRPYDRPFPSPVNVNTE